MSIPFNQKDNDRDKNKIYDTAAAKKKHFITGYVHVGILHEVKIFRKKLTLIILYVQS